MSEENNNGTIGTAVIVRPTSLPSVQEMRNKLEQRHEVRALLLTYLRDEMTEGQHFGTIPGTKFPMLYQDGARLVQTIFDVTAGKPELDEEYSDDGHYRVTVTVPLVSLATGEVLYYGMGTCSTRESKYAHRWVYENDVPTDVDKSLLKSVTKGKKPPAKGTYTKFLLPNPDLPDLHHTILTMALKRADTRATMRLPSVGDIFMEPDVKDTEQEDDERNMVLDKLRAWFRTCPLEQRDSVASFVFRVRSQKSLSELATDMLAEGLAILETADLDWASPTLYNDYKAWQKAKGVQSGAELFGESTTSVAHFVPEKKEQVEKLGETSVKLYEDRSSGQPPAEDIPTVELAPNVPISPGASPAEWRPSVPQEAATSSGELVPVAQEPPKVLDEKPTPQQRKLLTAAMKLAREAAKEAGVSVPALLTAVDLIAPEGFSRDYLSPKTYGDFGGWVAQVVDEFGQAAKNVSQISPQNDDLALPVLTLDTWLAETARGKGVTAADVVVWLREHDSQDLFGQASGLDPFADLPECLNRLDAILEEMPILSTVDTAEETQHTPA